MMTMSEYVHFQDDFSVFTPVVGVSDPVALLEQEVGWVYGDDLGYPRDLRGHILSPWRSSDEMLRSYSPMHGVASLRQPRPILAFSAQHDTRVTSWQTGRFIHALAQRFGADAPAYLIEHENVGHNGRAELVDEAVFIARQFGITALSPLRRPQ
jgi:prolyl oligopeptidase PreP (S9A serine peptidase family)